MALTPARLGHFHVLESLGEGGMGVLYRARDETLGRVVAIKLLRAEAVADRERTRRFVLEAQAASSLNHPNIVTVHEAGEDAAHGTYIVMECLEGETLRARLDRAPLAPAEALRIGLEMARGLAAAHQAGIVHRDVKPGNVMLTADGRVKLVDFGLAKLRPGKTAPLASEAPTLEAVTRHGWRLGTPAYMSPEQAEGRPVDARSDVFAFGAVLYEMLTGRRAFTGESEASLVSAILRDTPPPIRSLRREVDPRLAAVVERCLQKRPDARYPSAVELHEALVACSARPAGSRLRPFWLVVAALVVLGIVLAGAWGFRHLARERWARREALPEIQRLADADDFMGAFALAENVRPLLAGDPAFERLWRDVVMGPPIAIRSEPPGARVSVRPYSDAEAPWRALGTTPIEGLELPRSLFQFRLEKEGYAPVDVALPPLNMGRQGPFKLVPADQAPRGMVFVPGGPFKFRSAPAVELPDYWLDRNEVTNREFQAFVDAGGYRRPELWPQPFVRNGRRLSFAEAMPLFRDRTGRAGPSTWEMSAFPEGQGDWPVSGISWYEAAAYAAFAGKRLPTLHHWYRAADLSRFSEILQFSNFGGQGPRAVAARPGMTSYGNYDMAGNVREWVWNEERGRRFTLGGAWSDPTYLYTGPDALDAFDRSPILGLRCALYPSQPPAKAFEPVPVTVRDLREARPADDATFRIYSSLLAYDPADLDVQSEGKDESSEHWRRERVSFTAAYGDERIPARLFLPARARPPFQVVVYFPPGSARFLPSVDAAGARDFEFILRSGRAVLFPVYQQTYERRRQRRPGPGVTREVLTQRALDVRRALDFLQARTDVDHRRMAFYGLSMGADIGPMVGAVDDRLRTLVLVATGLDDDAPPEVDALHFAPRVRIPVLMINGRQDFMSPYETNQVPLFRLLGAPEADKRHAVFDSGHVPPWPDVVRETLDWLDRYLGPVTPAQPPAR